MRFPIYYVAHKTIHSVHRAIGSYCSFNTLPTSQDIPFFFPMQLSVEDADHGSNGQFTFSVNSDKFAVNSSTGILYTTQPLDREEQARYQLTVLATDGGGDAAKVWN